MRKALSLLTLLVLCSLVAPAGGCGEGSAGDSPLRIDEYNTAMDEWVDQLFAVPFPEYQVSSSGAPSWDEPATRAYLDRADELLAELKQMKPPAEVTTEHVEVVETTEAFLQLAEEYFAAAATLDLPTMRLKTEALKVQNAALSEALEQLQLAVSNAASADSLVRLADGTYELRVDRVGNDSLVVSTPEGLQAELAVYGSGVYVVRSCRGMLVARPR